MTGTPISEDQLSELKRAYRILGVPLSASSPSIKQAYRKLTKRWHPDLYPNGTPLQAESTKMMKLINEAYSAIAHAPLRYHIEGVPRVLEKRHHPSSPDIQSWTHLDTLLVADRLDYWIRFVYGALFGAFWSVLCGLGFLERGKTNIFIVVVLGSTALCGLGAARFGDRFWIAIFGDGERWW